MRASFATGVIVFTVCGWSPLHSQSPDADGFPPSWDLKQIEKDAPNSGSSGRFYVLAWHASAWKFEGKEHHVDRCLVIRAFGDTKADRWKLYHLYREPSKKDSSW